MTSPGAVSDGEAELVGLADRPAVESWLAGVVQSLLGVQTAETLFVSGRIDVVYGLCTGDGRRILVKVHRPPVDLAARRLVAEAQSALAANGFPCAEPLAGPVEIEGRVVSIETLLPEGERGDCHDPELRTAMATGLAEHVRILAGVPGLAERVGEAPAWCRYQDGAWASSHMDFFDFSVTPDDFSWVQEFAERSARRTTALRHPTEPLVSHADWYGGNVRFDGPRLVAAFDWDLMADTEPVVVGITAGMFSAGTALAATPPAPEEVDAFVGDYEAATDRRFGPDERRLAGAAACWSIAYTARCDVTMLDASRQPRAGSALELLTTRRQDYLDLSE